MTALLLIGCSNNDCEAILKDNCVCTAQYEPVCGCDNVTYGNACEAQCHMITDFRPGECN